MEEYTTVTLEEARANLPDLLRRVAEGEELIITDGGKPVASLTAPPDVPLTPEEVAAARAKATEAVKKTVRMWIEQGHPLPPDSPLHELLREES